MKKLTNLDVAEVSLVPRGANKKKFLVFKSKGNEMAVNQEILNLVNSVDPTAMAKLSKVLKSMPAKKAKEGVEGKGGPAEKSANGGDMLPRKDSAAYKAKGPQFTKEQDCAKDENGGEPRQGLSDRAQAALKAVARIIAPFKDEISDDHMDAVQHQVGIAPTEKPDEATPHDDMEKEDGDEDVQMNRALPYGVKEEDHAAALDMANKSYMDHLEKMGYRQHPDPSLEETNATKSKHGEDDEDEDEEDDKVGKTITKSLDLSAFPKGQREQLQMIFKANQDLIQKNADLEKELKIERDHRVTKEFQERAKGFKHLGANTDKVASILKSLAEINPEQMREVEGILKAADSQIGNGSLYREIGTRSSAGSSSAESRLDALVDSVVQKSDGNKSRAQLYDEVCQTPEGKRLLTEQLNEHHDNVRKFGGR